MCLDFFVAIGDNKSALWCGGNENRKKTNLRA